MFISQSVLAKVLTFVATSHNWGHFVSTHVSHANFWMVISELHCICRKSPTTGSNEPDLGNQIFGD